MQNTKLSKMNNLRENKLSRNMKVVTFFATNGGTLSANAPALTAQITAFEAKNAECVNFAQEADEDITGASLQKTYLRNQMRDLALAVSGALQAHFLLTQDLRAAEKAKMTKSAVDSARDTDAYVMCKRVLEQGQANAADLVPLGVTAATLTDLEAAQDAYWAYVQEPQDERAERTAALRGFDIAMAASEAILEVIKAIMLTQQAAYPVLYTHFLGSLLIDDNTGGGSPLIPDYTFTVNPGEFYTAVTIPYDALRRFVAKNLSNQNIFWGLSDTEGSFTSPSVTLEANATSNLLSSTLGASGQYLIFQNNSPEPIAVEVSIVDN